MSAAVLQAICYLSIGAVAGSWLTYWRCGQAYLRDLRRWNQERSGLQQLLQQACVRRDNLVRDGGHIPDFSARWASVCQADTGGDIVLWFRSEDGRALFVCLPSSVSEDLGEILVALSRPFRGFA